MSAATDKAQRDPWSVLYEDAIGFTKGQAPSREDVEATVVACAVLASAAPEIVGALVLGAALVEGLAWIASKLGAEDYCRQEPPAGPSDPRWLHFYDDSPVSWPGGVPSGAWANPAPGSFEAWAITKLAINWENYLNCRAFIDYRILLYFLAAAWNKTHQPGNATTINTRDLQLPLVVGDPGNGLEPPIDRIQWPTPPFLGQIADPPPWLVPFGPTGHPLGHSAYDYDLVVNRGAVNPQFILPGGIKINGGGGSSSASPAKKAAIVGAVIVGGGLGAALLYSLVKKQSVKVTLGQAWNKTKRVFKRRRR